MTGSSVGDQELLKSAWDARENARILGKTKVGAAVRDEFGEIHIGCNIEHPFRSHDIHAEIAALARLVSGGSGRASSVAVVAERDQFTPCGACMDWIVEIGGLECRIIVQSTSDGEARQWVARDLMPFYPH